MAMFLTEEEKQIFNPENTHWYFCMRAAEEFREANGRLPGEYTKAQVDEVSHHY